jgi:hypothetical protein
MPTKQQREQEKDMEQHERDELNSLIAEQVLHTLGQPADLLKVQVRWLWENCYRVNVFLGSDAASAKVAHSYFVEADSDGKIGVSTPKIKNQY